MITDMQGRKNENTLYNVHVIVHIILPRSTFIFSLPTPRVETFLKTFTLRTLKTERGVLSISCMAVVV